MVSKESLAKLAAKAVRIIPGVSSYQDKEELREIDKRLRNHLASTIDAERSRLDLRKAQLAKKPALEFLDDLDTLSRKMYQVADTIRFSAYGYSPLFDHGAVDRERLEKLYRFDQSLDGTLTDLRERVDQLVLASETSLYDDINAVSLVLGTLENKLKDREGLLRVIK